MLAQLHIPKGSDPDLLAASQAFAACERVTVLDPGHREAWVLGSRLLAHELGMLEQALAWWQQRREIVPTDPEPLIEQTSLFADLGLYDEARAQLARLLVPGIDSLTGAQIPRLERLHRLIRRAEEMEAGAAFTPWRKAHPAWASIHARADKGPVRDSTRFLIIAGPLVLIELFWILPALDDSWLGLLTVAMLIGATLLGSMGMARRMAARANRPALHLLRAMDVETSSGRVCIPEELRPRALYQLLSKQRTTACQERHKAIVERGEKLARTWTPNLPALDSVDEVVAEIAAAGGADGAQDTGPLSAMALDDE